jgi:catechol 2,3-dioxygenase-like lactoylglutathione lyase family enzyme
MPPKAAYSTPMLHVKDIPRSLRFYELLGFETMDTEADGPSVFWARMHCEGGAIMFLAEEPGHPAPPSLMLVLYTPELAALRQHLLDSGVEVSEIKYPGYMPSGEINFRDPDGNFLEICQWGKPEQERWEKHLEERRSKEPS